MSQDYTIHLCTGGLAHMLRLIGTTISYSELTNRKLIIYSETHHGFKIPFHEIFRSTNDIIVTPEEYDKLIHLYKSNPCMGAPKSLDKMKLIYIGSKEIGNKYSFTSPEIKYIYDLELDEELLKKEQFSLTTGQRWANPPLEGQRGTRMLPISGGWPTSLRSLKVNSDIIKLAKDRLSSIGEKYIGIHFRNTDMKHDINDIIKSTSEKMKDSGLRDILLATDDIASKDVFAKAFPYMRIHSFSQIPDFRKLGQSSIHYMSETAMNKSGLTKKNQIIDALCDIICLKESEIFIPSSNSAMSKIVTYLREENEISDNFLGFI